MTEARTWTAKLPPVEAVAKGTTKKKKKTEGPTATDLLITLVRKTATLFHGDDRTAYLQVPIDRHLETFRIDSDDARSWLRHQAFLAYGHAPKRDTLGDALATLAAIAEFDGQCRAVGVRVADVPDGIALDLADADRTIALMTKKGVQLCTQRDVATVFIRPSGMLALPIPVEDPDAPKTFREALNVDSDEQYRLIIGCLLGALRPRGPYPVLGLEGGQGTAKTFTMEMFRNLIDPNVAPKRRPPKETRDLMIAAVNSHVMALDNIRQLSDTLCDDLSSLATGISYAPRALHTNRSEVLLTACRPIFYTGIANVIPSSALDLLERAIVLRLPTIKPEARKQEDEMRAQHQACRPGVLWWLCQGMAQAIKAPVTLSQLPRLADWAAWVSAAEVGLGWDEGTILEAFTDASQQTRREALEGDLVAIALRHWLAIPANRPDELIAIGDLHNRLKYHVYGDREPPAAFPKNPRGLGSALRRLEADLLKVGISLVFADTPENYSGVRITVAAAQIAEAHK